MKLDEMSQTRIRAWIAVAVWTVAGAGFLLAFFMRGGPAEFDTDSARHLAGAAAIAFGFLAWWAALFRTRARAGELLADERDLQVAARAGQTTLIVVLVAIFVFTIGLWTFFEADGSVPVGWMWFLAYGSIILASITHGVVVLALDGRVGGNG